MNLTPEQIAAVQKANLETLAGLTNQAIKSVEKLVELNMQITKNSLSESMSNAKKTLEVRDLQQLIAQQAEMVQPMAEKMMAYGRDLYEIAQDNTAAFAKTAEAEMAAGQKKLHAMIDDWTKNAPAGSDAAVQMMKQAIAAANNSYETSQKAIKHAVEVAQSNVHNAVDTVTKAATKASKASKK
ncbi:MAG: phasin family protein [Burkholderiales bacterium]|jgi:phasin family protein|uniref:Phasin family protein n=1 Tax=Polynucleobacter sp. UK-FUSCHL-C3 TaxID=2955208 RepID=A0AAU8A4U9_9BURK|nr:phasin family protein [Burkholderiales bacterium]NBP21574.1 phasin family protein [Burkholderiaceae bacterium]NBP93449.1 phasin family protein [Burkholderiaceae bacterium]NCU80179.1 phasin family protein [Burkholderiaceae bacterium]NCY01073.1 phasin family protein [Burkholderiaceae bacterium]